MILKRGSGILSERLQNMRIWRLMKILVVAHIKKFIKGNLGDELNRNQIAAQVCMSPDYVSRVFRQKTGIQLSEYITDKRMQEARHLLESTNLPVGEIAFKVGYYNIAYFSRVFRIRNGVTPASWRTEFKNKLSR